MSNPIPRPTDRVYLVVDGGLEPAIIVMADSEECTVIVYRDKETVTLTVSPRLIITNRDEPFWIDLDHNED